MNWLKNISSKSTQILQAYKEGMKDFVNTLGEDIETIKTKNPKDDPDSPEEEKVELTEMTSTTQETNAPTPLEILLKHVQRFFKEEQLTGIDLEEIANGVKATAADITKKDPLGKILAHRTDFSNFPNFLEKFKADTEIIEAVLNFVPSLQPAPEGSEPTQKDLTDRLALRFFYVLIYEIDFKIRVKEKRKKEQANKKELKFTTENSQSQDTKPKEEEDDWQIEGNLVNASK